MIAPIRRLMHGDMGVTVSAGEFSAGYGVADLVGAVFCKQSCEARVEMGRRARRFAEEHLSLEQFRATLTSMYRELGI
jgi:hypothetical protein